jgi:hypothetical protein
VGAALGREDEIAYQAVDVGQVLDKMESAKNPLNLVILDACRNNPFARSWRGVKGGGLAQVDAPAGSLIAYATAPGKTAADGGGEHGLYTEALLAELHQPGLKLLDLFQEVRRRVLAASDGVQIPWESNSTVGTFYFRPLAEGEGGATPNPEAMERAFWDSVKDSQAAEDFTLYLTKYPQGTFAGLARQRREALRARIAEGRKKPGIVISVTTLGDCRDCEVEALVREGFQARGWREEAGAATLATVRAELEASTVASSDEVMAKWPVLRATLTITLSLKGQATPFKTLEIPLKAVAPTPLRCRDAFRKSLREALREQIPEPGSL